MCIRDSASPAGAPGMTVLQRDADGRLCRIDRYREVRGRQVEAVSYTHLVAGIEAAVRG